MFIAFSIIFTSAIIKSINEKSFEPFLDEVGNRFLLASKNLETSSQDIIDKGGVYDAQGNFFGDMWEIVTTFIDFFLSIFIIYMWIKVLMWIYGHSPLSDMSRWAVNFILSIGSFLVIEMLVIIVAAAINGEIDSAGTAFSLLWLPLRAFITFFKALPLVLSPISNTIGKIVDKGDTLNSTINSSINTT